MVSVCVGILLPFIGTAIGAGSVFLIRGGLYAKVQKILAGFAGGIMVAASVWSLLIPAVNMAEDAGLGKWSFLPSAAGFLAGVLFLLFLDKIILLLRLQKENTDKQEIVPTKYTMLVLAVTLHNIPEGMAVGVIFAGMIADQEVISLMAAFSLAIGIAIQNIPEGTIVSVPSHAAGISRSRAFLYGCLSGIVEPLGALFTILLAGYLIPVMPFLLAFAAGAMIYVVVEELIPESVMGDTGHMGTISFAVGFVLMMILDVALG